MRHADLERAVVASDFFGESLEKMRLLVIHDCHFVEMQATDPYLVLAKVAGYDTAVLRPGRHDTFIRYSSSIPRATCWFRPPS